MTTITLESVQAKQAEIVAMIEQLQAQQTAMVVLPETFIDLHPGERYAGAVLDDQGHIKHHVILMAERPEDRLDWHAAMQWAKNIGGDLPDRQEQALLYANCKPHLKADWHWSNQAHEDASYAWNCNFDYGGQYYGRKSFEGCAVAVRRV